MTVISIVGAGVAGLTVAVELAARGVQVEVFERASSLGAHACSWYAGGMLAPWCEGETADSLVVREGQQAAEWWEKFLPGSVSYQGSLIVAPKRDLPELARFARRTSHHRHMKRDDIAELEPDLSDHFSEALFFDTEAHIEPRQALNGLLERLLDLGGKIHFGSEITDFSQFDGPVIDARGFAARDQLQQLRGVRGEMVVVKTDEITLNRPIRLLHPRFPVYVVPREDGQFMIGATQIESEERTKVTVRGIIELLNAAYSVHPAFAEAEIIEMGVDVRPSFNDNCPRISVQDNIIYINGLFRHGFLMAPSLAKRAAAMVMERNQGLGLKNEDHGQRATA